MSGSSIDLSEVTRLGVEFGHAAGRAIPVIDKIVERAALGIKTTMADDADNDGHYKHFGASISYDRWYSVGAVAYVVGPDKGRRQGALGNILYFGGSRGGKVLDIEVGMRSEGPLFEKHLSDTAADLASGRG